MKKNYLCICTLVSIIMLSLVSYAGEWKNDENGYWYQNDDGSYKIGWYQDVDEKWYYFDNQTGYMLTDTSTPDGYIVNEDGEWEDEMKEGIYFNENKYKNKAEFKVTSYPAYPYTQRKEFDNPLPVTVYYNNEYDCDNIKVTILSVGLNKDGILYAEYEMSTDSYVYEIKVTTRYKLADGTYTTLEDSKTSVYMNGNSKDSYELVPDAEGIKPVSAEIYIDANKY